MRSSISWGSDNSISPTGTAQYMAFQSANSTWRTGVGNRQVTMPVDATFIDFNIVTNDPTAATSAYVLTLQKDGADTAVVMTVNAGSTTASYSGSAVQVTGGTSTLQWKITGTNTPNAITKFQGTCRALTSNNTHWLSSHSTSGPNTTTAQYVGMSVSSSAHSVNFTSVQSIMPTTGTVKNAYCRVITAPGAGSDWTFTLYKNSVATAISAVISGTNLTASDTTNSITIAAGDTLAWFITPNAVTAPTATISHSCMVGFYPDIDGETILTASSTAISTSAVGYYTPGGSPAISATETDRQVLVSNSILKKLYTKVTVAQGAGKTYQIQASVDASGTALTTTMSNATTGNDTSDEIVVTDTQKLSFKGTPTGTPTAARITTAVVSYIPPADFFQMY